MRYLIFTFMILTCNAYAKSLCSEILTEKQTKRNLIKEIWDVTKYSHFPGLLVKAQATKTISAQKVVDRTKNKRNIIFSFGLDEMDTIKVSNIRIEKYSEILKLRNNYYENQNNIRLELENLLRPSCLKKKKSTAQRRFYCVERESSETTLKRCLVREKEIGFDQTEIQEINKEMIELKDVKQYMESKKAKKYYLENKKDFSIDWEFKDVTHIRDLQNIINSPDIGNIIIVNHGSKSNGSLIDSYGNDIRIKTFLKTVSKSLDSISFFSCFSHLINSTYDLNRKFKDLSNPPKIIFVKKQKFLGQSGFTILKTLPSFIKQVEEQILNLTEKKKSTKNFHNICSIELTDFRISTGEAEVSLNHKFIGVINNQTDHKIEFPCMYLNKKNMVYITGISKNQVTLINKTKQYMLLSYPDGTRSEYTQRSSTIIDLMFYNLKFTF